MTPGMKHTFRAIGAGAISGMLIVVSLSGASVAVAFWTLLLPFPMLMAGLGLGTRAVLIAAISGTVLAMAANPIAGLGFALIYAAPTWLFVRLALTGPNGPVVEPPAHTGPFHQEGPQTQSSFRERILGKGGNWGGEPGEPPRDLGWFPAGSILAMVALVACGQVIAAALWTGGLESAVTQLLTEWADAIAAPQGQEVIREAIIRMTPVYAGLAAALWALMLLLNAVFAQGLLAKGGRNLRPTPRLRELRLPDWLSWALVVVALIALIAPGEIGFVSRNLVFVLAVPFFFLGLAVVHTMAGLTPAAAALLSLIYLVIIFTGWFALVIAGLGILEQWVGLKDRMSPPAQT